jgi:hypothetical protein
MNTPETASGTTPGTTPTDVLRDALARVHDEVPGVIAGLSVEELLWRPDADANHIAWLVWHLSRGQDEQVADVGGVEPVWLRDGWAGRFALPYPESAHGYGQTSEEVGAFRLEDPGLLTGYHEAVHGLTMSVLEAESAESLARVVDAAWDPPVTALVRLVSVAVDCAQHLGQAAYVRGLVTRRRA